MPITIRSILDLQLRRLLLNRKVLLKLHKLLLVRRCSFFQLFLDIIITETYLVIRFCHVTLSYILVERPDLRDSGGHKEHATTNPNRPLAKSILDLRDKKTSLIKSSKDSSSLKQVQQPQQPQQPPISGDPVVHAKIHEMEQVIMSNNSRGDHAGSRDSSSDGGGPTSASKLPVSLSKHISEQCMISSSYISLLSLQHFLLIG